MAMFGANILLEKAGGETGFMGSIVDSVLKRSDERRVFNQFLESETSNGRKITDLLIESSKLEAKRLLEEGVDIKQDVLLDFTLSSLKTKSNGHLSMHDTLVRKIVENRHPEFAVLHRQIDKGKFNGSLPFGYPDACKEAMGILTAKIKDTLSKIKDRCLEKKILESKIRDLAREMFYAVNRLGLKRDELVSYLQIIFDLSLSSTAPVESFNQFRQFLTDAVVGVGEVEFYFVKCLRFLYPGGNRLKILTGLGRENIEDKFGGIFLKTDEMGMFQKISDFTRIFQGRGVPVKFTILIADNDLDDNFPRNFGDIIPEADVEKARQDTEIYISNLVSGSGEIEVVKINDLIDRMGKRKVYEEIREKVISSLRKGDGKYVSERIIEDLVEYRFQRDGAIFEKATRELARERVYQKMASQIAIQVLANDRRVLITNSHGNENGLIAEGKVPVYFTDFYEEEKVFENVR